MSITEKLDNISTPDRVGQAGFEQRQLLAIMFVDACGFSRIMRNNENAALQSIGRDMNAIQRLVGDFQGTLSSFRGDGLLATFNSAADAIHCGLSIQKRETAEGYPIKFRVGVHIGDTFNIDGQLLGDCVNVAARIEALAAPGSILVSRPVYEALRGPWNLSFISVGTPYLKNIGDDLEIFQVVEQRDPKAAQQFNLRLIGRFEIIDPDGTEIIVSNDGKALLTVLALSQGGRCERTWLQEVVWDSYSATEQTENLEKAVFDLRSAFGHAFEQILCLEKTQITLLPDAMSCDIKVIRKHGWKETVPMPNLLEGFQAASVAFKAWLLHQRSLLRSAVCLRCVESPPALTQVSTSGYSEIIPLKLFTIALLPARTDGDNVRASFIADLLADWLVRSISETEAVEIHDYRNNRKHKLAVPAITGPDLMLECRAASIDDMAQISVNVLRAEDHKLIWSQSVIAEQKEFFGPAGTRVDMFVNYATDSLLSILASGRHMRDPGAHHAAKSAIGAVHRLLTMTGSGLDHVEMDLMAAYEIDPKPIYLAWLAYMSTFHVGERYGVRDAAFTEQTRALARIALESDPHNAQVLGLVAHVYSYIFHEFSFADDLISRALEANPFGSLTWDTASLLYSYTGRTKEAMRAAQNARRLGQHSPYRHLFDGACCVAAFVNGRFEGAVKYGESVMAVQPEFKAVLRYLAASYGHLGDTAQARSIMRRLIQLEPDLCIACLRNGAYPVPSKASARLIESGLSRIGLPEHP